MLRYWRKTEFPDRHAVRIIAIVSGPCPYPKGHLRRVRWYMWRYHFGLPLYVAGDCTDSLHPWSEGTMRPRATPGGKDSRKGEYKAPGLFFRGLEPKVDGRSHWGHWGSNGSR